MKHDLSCDVVLSEAGVGGWWQRRPLNLQRTVAHTSLVLLVVDCCFSVAIFVVARGEFGTRPVQRWWWYFSACSSPSSHPSSPLTSLTECMGCLALLSVGGHPQSTQTDEVTMLKELFSSLRDSVASSGGGHGRGELRHELNGVFSKLIEPDQFRRIAVSRLSDEERSRAPSSLQVKHLLSIYIPAIVLGCFWWS